ncbi:MAG TPA: zinc metalloprotease [Gaiellaceae bacterium]|nr:zinc metalloprotease [Gaiellaceae bacterium]
MLKAPQAPARWRIVALIALVAGVYVAATVSPAAAGTQAASLSACGSSVFDGLAGLGNAASTARGDDAREPTLNQVVEELPTAAKGKGGKSFRATVPVWFHVVHADGVGNISDAVIREQMRVLNAAFAGFYGGAATGFSFDLVGVTRTNNAEWHFAGPTTKGERDMKKALHRGGWNTLNLYATTAGAYLGWAYFPGLPESQQYLDGIVVDWESMPGTSTRYAGRYDLGHTATHEAGHWIHLHHTFNGGCNNWGDYVEDTPPQRIPTRGCPVGQDSCSEPGLDPIHNYMDYSYDSCYNQFTKGQVIRMQDAWLYYRA